MIPYLGCKKKIANEILRVMPESDNFYDLFGGGGSVSEAAYNYGNDGLFGKWRKWKNVYYNDIDVGVCELNKAIWSETFDFEKAQKTWISRERFFVEKDNPTAWGAFIRFCWSYGNSGNSYIYNKDVELAKCIIHHLIVYDSPFIPNASIKEKRLFMADFISKFDIIENCREVNLEIVERIQRLKDVKISTSNMDYRDVIINPNSVVYCDIPYEGSTLNYGEKFCYSDFYEWASNSKFPIYFSNNSAPHNFKCVWEKQINCKFNDKKSINRIESLYWNGK
jgi:site-specific DNA-adenine methylase